MDVHQKETQALCSVNLNPLADALPNKKYGKPFIYFLGLFFIFLPFWVDRYFGDAEFDQLVFTLKFGVQGILTSDPIFIKRFVKWCIFLPFILSVVFFQLEKRTASSFLKKNLCWIVLVSGFIYFFYQFHLVRFIRTHVDFHPQTDYFKLNYTDPRSIVFDAKKGKSLVLIYVESLESTYENETIFKKNLLTGLTKLKNENTSFEKFRQVAGTGWTIAGLVSSQCGIPLKSVTVFGTNRQGEVIDRFLLGAVCLSDILAQRGYQNIYMKGASLRFGGIKQFLKTHHYSEMYGREEWIKKGLAVENMNGWGLTDDALFQQAKRRLKTLINSGKRFNLTLLTVDTHGPDGYLNPFCQQKGRRDFEGVIECTGEELADFIDYIRRQGWLSKVSVVVLGDHLAMKNSVYDKLQSGPRYIFNLILTEPQLRKRTDEINHFDMLPTVLDALHIDYAGGKLGLGYSAVRRPHEWPLPAQRMPYLESYLENYSEAYKKLWIG